MSLQNTLISKLKHLDSVEILKEIGYRKINDKTISRLKNTLSSERLGLDENGFDFKYSNIEFIKALCDLCELDFNDYQDEIDNQLNRINTLKHAFRPYVFINTGFKRTTQPIFALAFLEGLRHLYLPNELKLESLDSQIEFVKKLIIEHYKIENGILPVWGEIKNYIFNVTEDSPLIFNPNGELVDNKTCSQNVATIKLGNKDITKLLS